MTKKIGLAVVLLALTTLVVSENDALAGRRHHGRSCGSCGTGCATACAPSGCSTGGCEAAPAAPAAPVGADAAPSPSDQTPVVKATTTAPRPAYTYTVRRRGFRR